MKQLSSSLADLRRLFERSITIRDLAEPLVSFDVETDRETVRNFMRENAFDVVGIRQSGFVAGYIREKVGSASDPFLSFADDILPESAPLITAFEALRAKPAIFVRLVGRVGGIVTVADLQKAPVRMWLFGVLSLLEMQMLRLIREASTGTSWQAHLTPDRIAKAEELFMERSRRNIETDLLDCLQWGDKTSIVLKNERLREATGYASRTSGEKQLGEMQDLRDNLAHSQDIVGGHWPVLADVAIEAESLLARLEKYTIGDEIRE